MPPQCFNYVGDLIMWIFFEARIFRVCQWENMADAVDEVFAVDLRFVEMYEITFHLQ